MGEFIEGVAGRRVADVARRGKYLIAPLDDGSYLVLHLGMTGSLRIHDAAQQLPPMARHIFPLDDGRELRFMDPRKFGHLWLLDDPAGATGKMGPEPLSPDFTPDALAAVLRRRKAPVKALLLEQSVVAGLGNLYADESLFLAGIHPGTGGQRHRRRGNCPPAHCYRHRSHPRHRCLRCGTGCSMARPAYRPVALGLFPELKANRVPDAARQYSCSKCAPAARGTAPGANRRRADY